MLAMNEIVKTDLERIYAGLTEKERGKLRGAGVLVTGCAGFLGYYFMNFFARYKKELEIPFIIGLDNFRTGRPEWMEKLSDSGAVSLFEFDVSRDDISKIPGAEKAALILHMASIASPTFYRAHPIETLDANVWGLRRLLDFYRDGEEIRGLLFFSSSEIYGDPAPEFIPTPESYRGYVDCQGPRACYDEAKRFGETLCYLYHKTFNTPVSIVRPFNNYGPGMRLNDRRAPADFALAVYENRDIELLSDGGPTRTFCYVSDAVTGFLKVLLHGGGTFNIGMDRPEITVKTLAEIYAAAGREILGYKGGVVFAKSGDEHYLTNNPQRRCPDISKAREALGYDPQTKPEEGVRRFLEHIRQSGEGELIWR